MFPNSTVLKRQCQQLVTYGQRQWVSQGRARNSESSLTIVVPERGRLIQYRLALQYDCVIAKVSVVKIVRYMIILLAKNY